MQVKQGRLLEAIKYYDPLLQRYARRLVHDEEMGAAIVKEVLEKQYELNQLAAGKHLRLALKNDVLNYCFYYIERKMSYRN
jgi:DNA-directed RNA polymerase specialized sigma24 family protein